jgi:hypothetical protein
MRTLKLSRHGMTMGTPPSKNNHLRAKRGVVEGWSESATRRLIAFLRSVDEKTLPETASGAPLTGYAVTLTLRDCPDSPDDWKALRNAYMERLRRMGCYRCQWVTEWQRRGVPHLHMAVWLPAGVSSDDLLLHWVFLTRKYRSELSGQHVLAINDDIGWFKYLSKHSARGLSHYQRSPENIPPKWKKKTGRVWGKTGDWVTSDPVDFQLSSEAYYRLRRIVQRWRFADARHSGNVFRIRAAKRMLAGKTREISDIRGISEWLDQHTILAVLDHLKADGCQISC